MASITIRRMTGHRRPSISVMIADSGCDQCVLGFVWRVVRETGRYISICGALAGRHAGTVFPVVTAVACLTDSSGKKWCAVVHEGLYDCSPVQQESLIASAQVRKAGNAIDDCDTESLDTRGQPGTQCSVIGGHNVPFFFDGASCYYELSPISVEEEATLPRLVFTSGDKPYEPTRRFNTRQSKRSPTCNIPWKETLGFPPEETVKRTLAATTQLVPTVQAETRELMRDHLATRIPELKLRRIDSVAYLDTFISSIISRRGYRYFNLYSLDDSGYDYPILMSRRTQSPQSVMPFARHCGIPRVIKSDNAKEFVGKRFQSELSRLKIDFQRTEPHHPNQNTAERRGGMLKAAVVHILTVSGAPLDLWCYAVEFVATVKACTARKSLNWRTPHELLFGETPDISKFRFPFYCPIWYYIPCESFPHPKMRPGRFLGFAHNAGDAFCYLILTIPEDGRETEQVMTRSVIRRRYPRQPAPIVRQNGQEWTVFMSDGKTPLHDVVDEDYLDLAPIATPFSSPPSRAEEDIARDSAQEFEDSLAEVYGPVRKRPRLCVDSDPRLSKFLDSGNQEHSGGRGAQSAAQTPVPEEMVAPALTAATSPETSPPTTTVPNNSFRPQAESVTPPAAATIPDPAPPENGPIPVTQDDPDDSDGLSDVNPEELGDIIQGLETDAEKSPFEDLKEIVGHKWIDGVLHLTVRWMTGDDSDVKFDLVKGDFPYETAKYIVDAKVGGSSNGRYSTGRHQRWAKKYLRTSRRVFRRVCVLAGVRLTNHQSESVVRRVSHEMTASSLSSEECIILRRLPATKVSGQRQSKKRKKTKPGRTRRPFEVKYGIRIPRDVEEAFELDKANGNTDWADAIHKEISTLIQMGCFEFKSPEYKPGPDYQFAPLRMIFEAKPCGRKKARLVAGGHLVDSSGISTRSTVVSAYSSRLMDIIAHRDGLTKKTGDVGNAFITAPCLEKVYSVAGKEFGDRSETLMIIKKALYGLASSSRAFRGYFADFLRSLGFFPARYDRDLWMRKREENDGYDYLCTHVDDFKIVARNPQRWIDAIASKFNLKNAGDPDYYLGNNYQWSTSERAWMLGSHTYIKECLRRIEESLPDDVYLINKYTPLPPEVHPELDETPLLDAKGIKQYQMMIGMAQWAVTISRYDIAFAVSSLSRFNAAPREGHLELLFHLFGYLKRFPNKRLVLDSRPLHIPQELRQPSYHHDFLDDYPDAREDLDPNLPEAFGSELETTIFFDSDHAHDHKTRRSISGIIVFVGRTPVHVISRRQGCIATSTYCAEFVAMRTAVEEAISLRYMLRSLGVPVTMPTYLFGDNKGSIQSANIPDGELKKKHVAISYHYVREAVAAKIVNVVHIYSEYNFADLFTKSLARNKIQGFVDELFV